MNAKINKPWNEEFMKEEGNGFRITSILAVEDEYINDKENILNSIEDEIISIINTKFKGVCAFIEGDAEYLVIKKK